MPRWLHEVKHTEPTTAEWRSLFSARREALEAACRIGTLEGSVPVMERWGWKACIVLLGRDQDGCLVSVIEVYRPDGALVYTRSVRLVREQPLPGGSTTE